MSTTAANLSPALLGQKISFAVDAPADGVPVVVGPAFLIGLAVKDTDNEITVELTGELGSHIRVQYLLLSDSPVTVH